MTETITMLTSGSYSDYRVQGLFVVPEDLDMEKLGNKFRHERNMEAARKREDYVFVDESEFVAWMINRKYIRPVSHQEVKVTLSDDPEYIPGHWSWCPECGEGRGQPRRDLSRYCEGIVTEFERCTSCGHEYNSVTKNISSK